MKVYKFSPSVVGLKIFRNSDKRLGDQFFIQKVSRKIYFRRNRRD